MNEHEQERIDQLLKMTLSPRGAGGEPRRDLWPAMLKRLDAVPAAVPWFDWALLAAATACLAIFPGAIPVLLYHL
jgi:hypothetical protein